MLLSAKGRSKTDPTSKVTLVISGWVERAVWEAAMAEPEESMPVMRLRGRRAEKPRVMLPGPQPMSRRWRGVVGEMWGRRKEAEVWIVRREWFRLMLDIMVGMGWASKGYEGGIGFGLRKLWNPRMGTLNLLVLRACVWIGWYCSCALMKPDREATMMDV